MKIKIARKDILGYAFLLFWAIVCIAIGIQVLTQGSPVSGTFSLVVGVLILAVGGSMLLRKN
ncbi:MAG: hypothetical protein FWF18_05845 [Dehalococcoidia bacterium]|nr:hypothetical protein [Dehalococcoidia bacterium]